MDEVVQVVQVVQKVVDEMVKQELELYILFSVHNDLD